MNLTIGMRTTLYLHAGQVLRVVSDADGAGEVSFPPNAEVEQVTAISSDATTDFGPYQATYAVVVTCSVGQLTITTRLAEFRNSAAANVIPKVDANGNLVASAISDDGTNVIIDLLKLPGTDPLVAGALWLSSGALKVSAGPPPP